MHYRIQWTIAMKRFYIIAKRLYEWPQQSKFFLFYLGMSNTRYMNW